MSESDYLIEAVIDRERRLFNLASIIRALTKSGATIQRDCKVDYAITEAEAKVLGIKFYQQAIEQRPTG